MLKKNIIVDLIRWIEDNIEQPLNIDIIAGKSGYSKWHLQRLFKEITGWSLASYIRQRRLTYAVLSLKLTNKPIRDIVQQYQFESQQSFNRLFKQQFGYTPACYRREKDVKLVKLVPEIDLFKSAIEIKDFKYVHLPKKDFWGVKFIRSRSIKDVFKSKYISRDQFFFEYFNLFSETEKVTPEKIYAFWGLLERDTNSNDDEQKVSYTIALDKEIDVKNIEKFESDEGLYLHVKFKGDPRDFENFILQTYLSLLPTLNVKRREGCNIEVFYSNDVVFKKGTEKKLDNVSFIHCDYYIPIVKIDKNEA